MRTKHCWKPWLLTLLVGNLLGQLTGVVIGISEQGLNDGLGMFLLFGLIAAPFSLLASLPTFLVLIQTVNTLQERDIPETEIKEVFISLASNKDKRLFMSKTMLSADLKSGRKTVVSMINGMIDR